MPPSDALNGKLLRLTPEELSIFGDVRIFGSPGSGKSSGGGGLIISATPEGIDLWRECKATSDREESLVDYTD